MEELAFDLFVVAVFSLSIYLLVLTSEEVDFRWLLPCGDLAGDGSGVVLCPSPESPPTPDGGAWSGGGSPR